MERLHVELFFRLQLDEAHGWTGGRLGDRLGVSIIILLSFDVGPHIFWRHQSNDVTLRRQCAAHLMGTAACFHRDRASRQLKEEGDHRLSPHPPPDDNLASRIKAGETATVLAKINPQHRKPIYTLFSAHLTKRL